MKKLEYCGIRGVALPFFYILQIQHSNTGNQN